MALLLRKTFGSRLSLPEVRTLCGTLQATALPTVCACPLCHGLHLVVYHDAVFGGVRGHCRACRFDGDGLELVAACRGVAPAAIVGELTDVREVAEHAVAVYRENAEAAAAIAELWTVAKRNFQRSSSTGAVLRSMGLRRIVAPDTRWDALNEMLGSLPASAAAVLGPLPREAKHCDLVVLPYTYLHRICGFEVLWGCGESSERRFFSFLPDGGLFGAWSMENAPRLSGHVLAVADSLTVARWQLRQVSGGGAPLPLASWRSDATSRGWCAAFPNKVIVLTDALTPDALIAAILAEGLLAVLDCGADAMDQSMPVDLARAALRVAEPWPVVLDAWLENASLADLEKTAVALEAAGLSTAEITMRCPKLGWRLQEARQAKIGIREVPLDAATMLVEKPDGWYLDRRGNRQTRLSNVIMRIDTAVSEAGKTRYEGRLLCADGSVLRFAEAADTVEKGSWGWMRDKLAAAGMSVPMFARAVSQFTPVELALLFKKPKTIVADGRQRAEEAS